MPWPKGPRKVPYEARQQHGFVAVTRKVELLATRPGWTKELGEVGEALEAWQASLVADLGGEETVSAMQRSIIEVATRTHLLLSSVDRYLLEQPLLINKCKRQLYPVVLQRQVLADALARYMGQLGLQRQAKRLPSMSEYLASKATAPPPMDTILDTDST